MTRPTPMLDAAIRAGCDDDVALMQKCQWPECQSGQYPCNIVPPAVRAALRAALPWTPPPEVIEAQRSAHCLVTCGSTGCLRAKECLATDVEHDREAALAAYRAHPLMSELWPEEER